VFNANIENEVLGSVAVDALTITFQGGVGKAQARAVFEELAAISQEGVEVWKGIGYAGWRVDDIMYGVRGQEAIMIAKGDASMRLYEALETVEPVDDRRVTRVDFCVDFEFTTAWPTYLREMHANKGVQAQAEASNRALKLISSRTGDTLYFGERTSPRYGRIYDKSSHYDKPLGTVYRYELETKKHIARSAIKTVFFDADGEPVEWEYSRSQIRRIIRGQFLKWGVNVEWDDVNVVMLRGEVKVTSTERQLEWLHKSVSPVVAKLRRYGYEQQAFAALGLVAADGEGGVGAIVEQ